MRATQMVLSVFRKAFIWRDRRNSIASEQAEDKKICDRHTGEWVELDGEQAKRYKKERYTYTMFKNLSEQFDRYEKYYLTDTQYREKVLTRLSKQNHTTSGRAFDTFFNDKNYFEFLFPELRFPKTLVRRIEGNYFDGSYQSITIDEAKQKLSGYSSVFFKKSVDTQHGEGVARVIGDKTAEALEKFGKNFVVQEPIRQHAFLADFNSTSVNAIRIITVYWKGHSYAIDARLRIGAPGSICDHLGYGGKNPLEVKINEDGSLKGKAFDDTFGQYYDTVFEKEIEGTIPGYAKMLDAALKGQERYPTYGLLGWDFTVNEDGEPLCIEVNSKEPVIKAAQCVGGPVFMLKTVNGVPLLDEIMSEPVDYGAMLTI